MKFISKEIITQEISSNDLFNERTPEMKIRDSQFQSFLKESTDADEYVKTNLKQSSPFKLYFDSQINLFKKKGVSTGTNVHQNLLNEFYSPCLFKLLYDQLYLIPLWSGLMIHKSINGYKLKTRISNNPVENHIGHYKNDIFDNLKVIII